MSQVKIGIQIGNLRLPFKQALHTAQQLGAEVVEIDARTDLKMDELSGTGLRQVRKMLDDLNLRVAAVRFRTRRGYDVVEDLDRRIDATKKAMEFAHSLGAPVVVNQIGKVPEDSSDSTYDRLRQVIEDLARFGQKAGAFLAAETGSEPVDRLAALLSSIQSGICGITLNPGNLLVNGFEFRDKLSAIASQVLLVHAKDGVQDLARGRGFEVPLGRGSADFEEILAVLEERQFRGALIVEREQSDEPIRELRDSIEFLRRVSRGY